MADTKITALAAIATVDPAADVLPIVDISDTSMAASGTTKKVTTNQILGSSGVATLASATITGDLTVDTSTLKVDSTNDRVGIGQATPAYKLHVQGNAGAQLVLQSNNTDATAKEGTVSARHYTNAEEPISTVGGFATSTNNYVYLGGGFSGGNAATFLGFHTAANNTTVTGTERYRIDSSGISIWSVAGTTAMTLNSTGLGVGASPSSGGSISNASYVLGGIFSTLNGILSSVATATPTTIFAAPSDSILMVTASVNGAAPSDYKVVAVVKRGGAAVAITTISSATSVTITSSGTDIQATQTSGGNQNIYFNVLRLA